MKTGDRVSYRFSPRGGWGYVFRTEGTVVSVGSKRVAVRLQLNDGTEVIRRVKPEFLDPIAADQKSQETDHA